MTPTYLAAPAERMWLLADHILAGRPPESLTASGTIQHLFTNPGERSLCGATTWLDVIRWTLLGKHVPQPAESGRPVPDAPPFVTDLAWVCTRCQAEGIAIRVGLGECPACRAPLSDPSRSPGGWAHCRACRRGWLVEVRGGVGCVSARDWAAREVAA